MLIRRLLIQNKAHFAKEIERIQKWAEEKKYTLSYDGVDEFTMFPSIIFLTVNFSGDSVAVSFNCSINGTDIRSLLGINTPEEFKMEFDPNPVASMLDTLESREV